MLTYEYSTLCLSWNRTLQQPAGCPGVGWEKADSRSGGYIEGVRMNIYDNLKEFIDQANQLGIPYFCFDHEVVNLKNAYDQFVFSANCAVIADSLALHDLTGCLDSGLL